MWVNDCGVNGTSCGASPTLRSQFTGVNLPGNVNGSQIQTIWLENWANPASVGTGPLWDQLKVSIVGPIGFAASAGVPNTSRQTLVGTATIVGQVACRVLGTVVSPRPSIRGLLLVLGLALPFGLLIALESENQAMKLFGEDRTVAKPRWARLVDAVRTSEPGEARKWSALSVGGGVGVVAALIVIETVARWLARGVAWTWWRVQALMSVAG